MRRDTPIVINSNQRTDMLPPRIIPKLRLEINHTLTTPSTTLSTTLSTTPTMKPTRRVPDDVIHPD